MFLVECNLRYFLPRSESGPSSGMSIYIMIRFSWLRCRVQVSFSTTFLHGHLSYIPCFIYPVGSWRNKKPDEFKMQLLRIYKAISIEYIETEQKWIKCNWKKGPEVFQKTVLQTLNFNTESLKSLFLSKKFSFDFHETSCCHVKYFTAFLIFLQISNKLLIYLVGSWRKKPRWI